MSTEAVQHHRLQLPRPKDLLNVPAPVAAADAVQERRGSTESAYYSVCSDGDRRSSWQNGLCEDSAAAVAATDSGAAVRRASSTSALCEECEIRRFRPTDRSPFHTRAHAEAVMAEFASLHGERAAAAAAGVAWNPPSASVSPSPATSTSAKPQPLLLLPPPSSQPHSPHCLQLASPVSPSASIDPLPTLAEEDTPADMLSDSLDGSVGMPPRLNTVSSCDLRRNRRLSQRESIGQTATTSKGSSAAAEPISPRQVTAASLASTSSASKRKFSLDASTVTTPSLGCRPGQLLRRPSVAGGSPAGGLFRLFHHETTPEELAVFNQSRRGSKIGTQLGAEAEASPPPPDQNPSRLFRRFQSTDDDYFVALKVEEQPAEMLPAFVGDRQKLLSVGEDGNTVVTDLSQNPEVSTPTPGSNSEVTTTTAAAAAASAATTDCSADTTDSPATETESEIEIALRLAKTSPFAYVPPAKLQAAPAGDCRTPERRRPSAGGGSTTQRRNSDWRRCVSELTASKCSRSSSTGGEVGVGFDGGSRVKLLMARFGDGK